MLENPILSVDIPRDRWAFGKVKDGRSPLLYSSETGKACAMGHYLKAAGYRLEELDGVGEPEEVIKMEYPYGGDIEHLLNLGDVEYWVLYGVPDHKVLCSDIIAVNDRGNWAQDEIEQELIRLFAAANVEVNFVNTVEDWA